MPKEKLGEKGRNGVVKPTADPIPGFPWKERSASRFAFFGNCGGGNERVRWGQGAWYVRNGSTGMFVRNADGVNMYRCETEYVKIWEASMGRCVGRWMRVVDIEVGGLAQACIRGRGGSSSTEER